MKTLDAVAAAVIRESWRAKKSLRLPSRGFAFQRKKSAASHLSRSAICVRLAAGLSAEILYLHWPGEIGARPTDGRWGEPIGRADTPGGRRIGECAGQ